MKIKWGGEARGNQNLVATTVLLHIVLCFLYYWQHLEDADVSTAVHTPPLTFVTVHYLSFHLMHSQHEMQEANEWMTLWLGQPFAFYCSNCTDGLFLDNGACTDRDSNARLPTRSQNDNRYPMAFRTVRYPYRLLFHNGEFYSGAQVMRKVTHCLPVTLPTSKVGCWQSVYQQLKVSNSNN